MTDKEIKKILNDRINTFNKCKTDNQMWPGYSDHIIEIELPGWAQK